MLIRKFQEHYRSNAKAAPVLSFVVGFLFDIATMGRIDSWIMISQQGLYLVVIGVMITFELWERGGQFTPPEPLRKFWLYREAAVHFMLGALLSAYTLFYFKSASIFTAFLFLFLLSALLVANEFSRIRGMGFALRAAMFSLCLASYFIYTIPILLGFVGTIPFLLAIAISAACGYGLIQLLKRRLTDLSLLKRQVIYPHAAIHIAFVVLYFFHAIPPVPVSISYMGIYHHIEKEDDKYLLSFTRPTWKFWEHGDQSYTYQEGDRLFGFASIFAPSGFKDQVNVRWLYKEPKYGWQTQDVIPIKITGGRDDGFRGYTVKEHFRPGKWRFQVETQDGREIGRLYFDVSKDTSLAVRPPKVEIR